MGTPGLAETVSHEGLSARVSVPFPFERDAQVVYNALRIDPDPKRSGCSKKLSLEGNVLVADFTANQAKHLRVGINSFFDLLLLAIKTVEHFGHPSS